MPQKLSSNPCSLHVVLSDRKQDLQRHLRYHTGAKPFQCPHCNFCCSERSNLKIHIGRHFSQRDHVCEKCGAAFHAKTTLDEHIIYKHTEARNFHCTECPRSFKTAKALKKHNKVHADLKEHKCAYCNTGFNRLYNLRHHMRTVHGNDDPLPSTKKVGLVDVPEELRYMKGSTAVSAREKGLLLDSGRLNPEFLPKEEKLPRPKKAKTAHSHPAGPPEPPQQEPFLPGEQQYEFPTMVPPVAVVPVTEHDPTLQTEGSRLYRCLLTPASLAQAQAQTQVQAPAHVQAQAPEPILNTHSASVITQPISHLSSSSGPVSYVVHYNVPNQ